MNKIKFGFCEIYLTFSLVLSVFMSSLNCMLNRVKHEKNNKKKQKNKKNNNKQTTFITSGPV